MKPIHLNLASRPYRDYRPVYAVVVVLSLVTAFLMLNNIETYYRYKHDTRNTSTKISQIDAQIRQEKEKETVAKRRLGTLDLASLEAQTRFVNTKLAERAFSWSTLLDELESVVAQDVRLISVAPSFNKDGTIGLSLAFEAKGPNGMIATINSMNRDPQFSGAFPSNESRMENGYYAFNLTVQYLPPAVKTASARSTR